ncbi:MAG: radical SAM protein [Nitrospinae bacterium]|nr:radical SAM protein [Nitrospinota bacterium]
MTSFIDPSISRKSSYVDGAFSLSGAGMPLPSVVEVSESGTCNRTCSFCPRSSSDYPDVKEFIVPGLLDKLTSELETEGFCGVLLFSGFVEPMLDKNIYDLISLARKNLSKARIELVTNGDTLNDEKIRKLFKHGLNTILISVYDSAEDAERFENLCKDAGLSEDQFVVRHRYLPEEQSFGISLSNRAGMMENAEYSIATLRQSLEEPCYYPHYTFFMDYTGEVLLCPHDWGKKLIVGNMQNQSFMEIWLGDEMMESRRRLYEKDRCFEPCAGCDARGDLMGAKHAKAWRNFEQAHPKNNIP